MKCDVCHKEIDGAHQTIFIRKLRLDFHPECKPDRICARCMGHLTDTTEAKHECGNWYHVFCWYKEFRLWVEKK